MRIPYVSNSGRVARGTKAAAAFHAVTAKKLYSNLSLARWNSDEINSAAVVMDVAFSPTMNVTQHEVAMGIHFRLLGQLKGFLG
jgi:hypothetical protein